MSLVVIAIELCLLLSFMGFEGDDGDEETKTMGKKRFISSLTSTRKRRTLHSCCLRWSKVDCKKVNLGNNGPWTLES
jgi:hypothetical protein